VMAKKRLKHGQVISKLKQIKTEGDTLSALEANHHEEPCKGSLAESTQDDIASAFSTIVQPKALKKAKVFESRKKKRSRAVVKDEENFISYQAKDHHTEAGYSMLSGFEADASKAVLDLTGDDDALMRKKRTMMRWDAKKKKYVKDQDTDGNKKRIKTESGVWIPASYKSDRYAKWRERSKIAQMQEAQEQEGHDDQESENPRKKFKGMPSSHPAMRKAKLAVPKHKKGPRAELKRPEQVLKQRRIEAKTKMKNKSKKKPSKKR